LILKRICVDLPSNICALQKTNYDSLEIRIRRRPHAILAGTSVWKELDHSVGSSTHKVGKILGIDISVAERSSASG